VEKVHFVVQIGENKVRFSKTSLKVLFFTFKKAKWQPFKVTSSFLPPLLGIPEKAD
jgi:hypothetical protein